MTMHTSKDSGDILNINVPTCSSMEIAGLLKKKKKMKKITRNCEIVYEQIFMWSIGGVYHTFWYT